MGWFILAQVFSILIMIVRIGRLSKQENDLEILILRQQLAIMQRKQEKPVKPNRAEKMMLGEFINDYYNVACPHQGIVQQTPIPYGQV